LAAAHFYLAQVYEEKGTLEEAVWYYRRAIDLDREGNWRARACEALEVLNRGENRLCSPLIFY
jgi:hypothetical protein